ncbi:hypothetical protein DM860_007988 [Cuscuta australis]|uniref:Uncharacterized protein n=1 Tax=Cuscuta australis TaxID=267555 RepID=A0A328DX53_9ASTE|nr:hypothetical protein DM860_007988 [Cuscuta australis]
MAPDKGKHVPEDPMVLKKYFDQYKTEIQKHNASLFAPVMLFNLEYVFLLIWSHPRQGWDLKIFELLAQERIQISLHLLPVLDFILEICYWVGIPHYLNANSDASLKSRAIGMVLQES